MMKRLFPIFLSFLAATSLVAQLPVSTTPENKNVVLEEYTGIYCVFCPDGHKLASQFRANNPGDVVLINIHTGGYANPNGNDPDFRTTVGTLIASPADIAGYPAGSINRRVFPQFSQRNGSAMSRNSWSTAGATVLSESSYVNIAMEGFYDLGTNELTVDVELYFTGTVPSNSQVKLFIALLQNNVEGPQTGATSYNPRQVLPNGNYNHQHMFRDLLTSRFGDQVDTENGNMVSMSYTYSVPADFKGIATNPADMELAAFVAEGTTNIITGTNGTINYGYIGLEETSVKDLFKMYPNPANDLLQADFNLREKSQVQVDVFDLTGRKMLELINTELNAGNHQNKFDISKLRNGTYLLRTEINGKLTTTKLVVQ